MAETGTHPQLTLMAVHAHPDDESSSTGGVLAKYAEAGVRTVVVTCTNGEFGDTLDGVKPGEDGHDEQAVAQIRLAELREACKHLAVTDLELLGYHDSGMPDWEYRNRPDAFCNVPQDEVAARIGGLIEQFQPQVVITYDDKGAYQHPDHLHASRCAQAAVAATGIPDKLYLTAMRRGDWRKLWDALREQGVDVPDVSQIDEQTRRQMEEREALITTSVDIRNVLDRKYAALMSHASQIRESWFSKIPPGLSSEVFGRESFIRATDRTGTPVPEDDIFAGIRVSS
jgi:LmbE family N-acetylglucosaminyl deacetylase